MTYYVLAFLVGVLTLPLFSFIPNLLWFIPPLFITAVLWKISPKPWSIIPQFLCIGLLGCLFVLYRSEQTLRFVLPHQLESKTVTVVGTIVQLPIVRAHKALLLLKLHSLENKPAHTLIRLAWYPYYADDRFLQVGDQWRLQVRLKRPHSTHTPGGFDYTKWLFTQGIRATGYVVDPYLAKRLAVHPWHAPINHIRQMMQERLVATLKGLPTAGLVRALIVGDQSGITEDQWHVMQSTGTNHLMAIAGVHIAFVASFVYLLVHYLWRRSRKLPLLVPAPSAASISAFCIAIIYSAFAGFSLPTQRALIMLSVFTGSHFLKRNLGTYNAFLLALAVQIVWDPVATLSASFWLSFGAVFAILYGTCGRMAAKGFWWKYMRVQYVITLLLMPVSLALFAQTALISLFANLLAIPAVGFGVLPLCLLGAALLWIAPLIGHSMLWLAAQVLAGVFWFLTQCSHIPGAVWHTCIANAWIFAATLLGSLLLLLPRGIPIRFLGVLWFMPLVFYKPHLPEKGNVKLTLLDVGERLSAVLQTQHHTLVYDIGRPPKSRHKSSTQALLLFLQKQGIKHMDIFMTDYLDSHHANVFVKRNIRIKKYMLPQIPQTAHIKNSALCRAGMTWQWDGVRFAILYPSSSARIPKTKHSCVLLVQTQGKNRLLLTGNIGKSAQNYVIKHKDVHNIHVLVAPAHGSAHASSLDFIQHTHPDIVLFATSYQNPYHFPNPMILSAYKNIGTKIFNTAEQGTISIMLHRTAHMPPNIQYLDKSIWQ